MRKKVDPTDMFIIMLSLSTQDFEIPDQFLEGSAASICLTAIKDMRLKNMQRYYALSLGYPFEGPLYNVYMPRGVRDDGFSIMEHVPVDLNARYRRRVYTANRSGFYIKSEQSQSNVKNMRRKLFDEPQLAISTRQWSGCSIIVNSWAWLRCVHFIFSANTIFNLCVLLVVIYRNFQRRIGDAFISISDTLQLRGVLVIAVWAKKNFWQVSV